MVETEIPPQVEAEASHTSFPIWRITRPYDGVSVRDTTCYFAMPPITQWFRLLLTIFSCKIIIPEIAKSVPYLSLGGRISVVGLPTHLF